MSKFDRFLSIAVLGLMAPVALLLLFWWSSVFWLEDENIIGVLAILGIAAGVVLDFTVLKKFIRRLFYLSWPALLLTGLFYSALVYGAFMGLPLFNSVVGIVFGYIAAKRCLLQNLPQPVAQKNANRSNIFFMVVLVCLCVASAALALTEPTITSQIQGMLGLPFEVSLWMIWALILVGGTLLVLFQFFTARLVAELVLKKANSRGSV